MTLQFKGKSPCKDCPYRKDAPLQKWSSEEFADLIVKDKDETGSVYGCHKKNGTVCKGWLMDQDERRLPSIMLRLELSKQKVTREYLDNLTCSSERFHSIAEMASANYPEIFEQNKNS